MMMKENARNVIQLAKNVTVVKLIAAQNVTMVISYMKENVLKFAQKVTMETKKPKHANLATIHARPVLDQTRMTVHLVMLLFTYTKVNVLKNAQKDSTLMRLTENVNHVTKTV
jgi:hypothetical protein